MTAPALAAVKTRQAILNKVELPPVREPLPPPRVYAPPRAKGRRGRGLRSALRPPRYDMDDSDRSEEPNLNTGIPWSSWDDEDIRSANAFARLLI
jgi:hypothetical protein